MNVLLAAVVGVVLTAITVTAMLLVRRRAPEGSYFSDGDRASGVFGVLATGFSVLLGFIIFLAFSSYDDSRTGAETEATIVAQQVQTAQFLPGDAAAQLTGELTCYARSVAGPEWDAQTDGTLGDRSTRGGWRCSRRSPPVHPRGDTEQSAYDRWMDQTAHREQARIDRVHGAEGILPPAAVAGALRDLPGDLRLHAVLRRPGGGCGDPGRADGQRHGRDLAADDAAASSSTTRTVTGSAALQPTAMERTIRLIDAEARLAGITVTAPCDDRGTPR